MRLPRDRVNRSIWTVLISGSDMHVGWPCSRHGVAAEPALFVREALEMNDLSLRNNFQKLL